MFKAIKLSTVTLFIVFVSACSIFPQNQIDVMVCDRANEIDAYLVVYREEINNGSIRSTLSATKNQEPLFALMDTAVDAPRSNNNNYLKPFRNSQPEFFYAKALKNDVLNNFNDLKWIQINRFAAGDKSVKDRFENSTASTTIFMAIGYKTTLNFDAIEASLSLIRFSNKKSIYEFKEKLDNQKIATDQLDNIYRNDFIVNVTKVLNSNNEEDLKVLAINEKNPMLHEIASSIAQNIFINIQIELDDNAEPGK
ncbi:MAG: hypothetical protein ACJAUP_002228 [Cellvibrionaceae bacterium]|jgi:hypothetical protein